MAYVIVAVVTKVWLLIKTRIVLALVTTDIPIYRSELVVYDTNLSLFNV